MAAKNFPDAFCMIFHIVGSIISIEEQVWNLLRWVAENTQQRLNTQLVWMRMNTCESRQHYLKYYKLYILNQHTNLSVILEWRRQIQIVTHKNYILSGSEGFVIILTSKSITCFIEGFTLIMKSQSIAYLLNGSEHIYIGFWALRVKCTQYGICSQAASKDARAMFFSKLGGASSSFRSGSKISREGWPRPDLTGSNTIVRPLVLPWKSP